MMKKLLLLMMLSLLVIACGQVEPDVVSEPAASESGIAQVVEPTDAPTAAPTAVPEPTPMPEPTEAMVEESGDMMESDPHSDDMMTESEEMTDAEAAEMAEEPKSAEDYGFMESECEHEDHDTADDSAMEADESEDMMAADGQDDDAMMEESADMAETEESHSDDMMAEEETMTEEVAPVVDRPEWQTLPLVNVATGESFTLADFSGKTVFVEPMATWCGNCRQQLNKVLNAMATVGGEDVVFVVLSVETNLSNDQLLSYAQGNGYPFEFAVMTPDFLEAVVGEFGRTVANPPSTPHFIVRPDGTFTQVATGMETTDEIIAEINELTN